MSKAAELLEVCVADACCPERFVESVHVELGAVARSGYRPDVYDLLDAMMLQYSYEPIDGMG